MSQTTETKKSETSGMKLIKIKRFHDIFVGNLMLLLNMTVKSTHIDNYKKFIMTSNPVEYVSLLMSNFELKKKDKTDTDDVFKQKLFDQTQESVVDNLSVLQDKSNKFLQSIINEKMNMENAGNMIKKMFIVVSPIYNLLLSKNPVLFQQKIQKDGKMVTITIIPGFNLIYGWYCMDKKTRDDLWFYLENMFSIGARMILLVSGESTFDVKQLKPIDHKRLRTTFESTFPDIVKTNKLVNIMNLDVDMIGSIGSNDVYSVNNMIDDVKDINMEVAQPGIESFIELAGVDKMINMDELIAQLKTMGQKEIDEATTNIKNILGNNVNKDTSNMISNILTDITTQLKTENLQEGNPIKNIVKIAEKVAEKTLPTIDPSKIDIEQLMESTQKFTQAYKDKDGNPMFGNNAPMNMLLEMARKNLGNKKLNMDQLNKMNKQMIGELTSKTKHNKKEEQSVDTKNNQDQSVNTKNSKNQNQPVDTKNPDQSVDTKHSKKHRKDKKKD